MRWLLGGAALAAAGVCLVVALQLGGGSTSGARTIEWSSVPRLETGPPPWESGSALLPTRLAASGLHALTMEGAVLHTHQHLDVYVDGQRITVPAFIGIDPQAGFLTEIHTHDPSGIIHVESPTQSTFTLGQLFCEWGVKLTASCLGPYHGPVSWWVNGKRMTGDPGQLVLREHQEIVVAAGRTPAAVPSSFSFPPGL
jgi:hypothetical protein